MSGLAAHGLQLHLGGFTLGPLDLAVPPGEALLVFGPSLAGKTRLLKALVGLTPARGQVRVDAVEADLTRGEVDDRLRARVGMVFQNDALFDDLTVAENVALPLRRRRAQNVDARVRESLAAVGLADAAEKLPAQLSGGMRKRAGLARALAAAPPVLLIDEPLAGLDPGTQQRIAALLDDLRRRGRALVIAVADPAPLWRVCGQALALDAGRVVASGAIDAVRRDAAVLLGAA